MARWPNGSTPGRTARPLISALPGPVTQAFRVDPGRDPQEQGRGRLGVGAVHQPGAEGCRRRRLHAHSVRRTGLLDPPRRLRGDGRGLQRLRRGGRGDHRLPPLLRQLPRPARHLASQLRRRLHPTFKDLERRCASTSSSPTAMMAEVRAVGKVWRRQDPLRGGDRRQRPQPGAGGRRRRPRIRSACATARPTSCGLHPTAASRRRCAGWVWRR